MLVKIRASIKEKSILKSPTNSYLICSTGDHDGYYDDDVEADQFLANLPLLIWNDVCFRL